MCEVGNVSDDFDYSGIAKDGGYNLFFVFQPKATSTESYVSRARPTLKILK